VFRLQELVGDFYIIVVKTKQDSSFVVPALFPENLSFCVSVSKALWRSAQQQKNCLEEYQKDRFSLEGFFYSDGTATCEVPRSLDLMMTRMTSLIMVVGEQIKCFLSSLCNAHANVADGQWVIVGGLAHVTRCHQFRIIRTCAMLFTPKLLYLV